jgi:hypothetical protein
MRRRVRTVGLLLSGGCLAGLAAVRVVAVHRIESAMERRSITWGTRVDHPLAVRWRALSGPGLKAKEVEARAAWPPRLTVRGTVVDLQSWVDTEDASGGGSSSVPVEVWAEGLSIAWGPATLLGGLSGEVWPDTDLSGATGALRVERDAHGERTVRGVAEVDLPGPHLRGTAKMEVLLSSLWRVRFDAAEVVVEHPALARGQLAPVPASLDLAWEPSTHALAIDGTIGTVRFLGTGSATASPPTLEATVRVPPTDLDTILALFGDRIPEARSARTVGTVGLTAQVKGPPWSWTIEPKANGLGASGVLPDEFQRQSVAWTTQDETGFPVVRRTGPVHPGWTDLPAAGPMPLVVAAAEDVGFRAHRGYDLAAIREALQSAEDGKPLRGGSTLTQQLAKNLFLSDERTLTRKLRELLYALDLERTLPKDAILALYLNVVEFGPGLHGIAEGADAYFLKSPQGLTLKEAAFLASILPAPTTAWKRAKSRGTAQQWRITAVLDRMAELGWATPAQVERARAERLRFVVE